MLLRIMTGSIFGTLVLLTSPAGAQQLQCGENITDNIAAANQVNVYLFQGNPGDTISLVLHQTGGNSFTAHGDLYAPSSTSVPIVEDLNGENQIELTESGTYFLQVHADTFFYTGSYALEMNRLSPSAEVCDAQSLACGQNVAATITGRGEQQFFTFGAVSGDTISLVLNQTGGNSFTAHGDLYGPASPTVPLFEDLNGENQINLTQTGTYTLRVHASSFYYTGSFALEFDTLAPAAQQCDALPLSCGQNVATSITGRGEQQFYSLDLVDGDTISLVLNQTGGSSFTAHGDLYEPGSSTPVASNLNGENQLDITQAGTYTLRVRASSFYYTGSYSLEFNVLSPVAQQCDVLPLECGAGVATSITGRGEQQFYALDLVAGDTISLVLNQTGGNSFTVHGDMYGPSSATLPLLVELNGQNFLDITETGVYTLRVHAHTYYYTGSYSLEFNVIAPRAQQCEVSPALLCGDQTSASLTTRGEQHLYPIDGLAGDVLSLHLVQTGGNSFTAHGDLYEPNSTVPLIEDLNGLTEITLPQTGVYTLVVHADTYYYTGSYDVEVIWTLPFSQQCYEFTRGDVSLDGSVNLLDVILTLNYLFLNEPQECLEALDSNDDASLNLVDPIHTLNYLFSSGSEPGAPFPDCGIDDNPATSLGCSPSACP